MRRRAVIQMIVIGFLAGLLTVAVAYFVPWLPEAATTQAVLIDEVFWMVAIICVVIFALVAGVSIYSGWKFRAPSDDMDDGAPIHGHTGLEIWWTAIPTALVVAMAVFSGVNLMRADRVPSDHRVVEVSSQQFAWSFTYPDLDRTDGNLVLEVGEPVLLVLTAKDVIHSFWVPEFRMKQDAVPGIETQIPITPTKIGEYDVICTELCGLGHATMRARAIVLSHADYEAWVAAEKGGGQTDTGGQTGTGGGGAEANGAAIFESAGCAGCHTLSAAGSTAEVGPNLDSVLGGMDEAAIRAAIVDPNAEIADGYQPNVMPQDFGQRLSDEELAALVAFLVESGKARR
jgi:cytochrome c oxidase subunit 2